MAAGTVTGDALGRHRYAAIDRGGARHQLRRHLRRDWVRTSSTNAGSGGTFNEFEGLGGNDTITGNGNTRIAFYNALDGVTVDLVGRHGEGTARRHGRRRHRRLHGRRQRGHRLELRRYAARQQQSADTSEMFEGRAGNDTIDGRGGYDLAVYNNDGSVTAGIAVTATATTMTVTGDARSAPTR